ncbi:unnamed protein product [Rotaria socialis]|uniref:Uncharacterized protein n=1 Tax=Rotaria socialis TaxID=392032 RepID=A0A817WNX5_9BILA|nr:unnamed protein product [Rotaria socialis]CAF3358168.1 unnamed protein product [Rotaria socialis]CAF3370424.1 unnamed protein product [Rotaria socialis]CAF3660887.1 unnamed protein product [Rotaria socialis]CAF3710894.1 unnamed protein product [Rotaria socialis]
MNDGILQNRDDGEKNSIIDKKLDLLSFLSSPARCIPVQAVKELGCIFPTNNITFQGLFRSICERHRLCYACGFASSITKRQCNKIALVKIYHACAINKTLSAASCIKQSFTRLSILRQDQYRTSGAYPGFSIECRQNCVLDYLRGY